MSIPNFQRFIDPLLRFLALHPNGVDKSEADEAVASALGLTDVEKDTRLPCGKQHVYNVLGRAGKTQVGGQLLAEHQLFSAKVTERGYAYHFSSHGRAQAVTPRNRPVFSCQRHHPIGSLWFKLTPSLP